ncbi:MAG: NAD(P)(+) transhydrogenase (Re/Si-specific) subunit beta [Actinobacteria bacterium]|nr:NAD(P)(+) transhydrogenase (Re/Si-specific) subunit beta [Actinomycetota bacterium]
MGGGTTTEHIINVAYLVAVILFIVGLKKLTSPTTARQGNMIAGLGMVIALIATLFLEEIVTYEWIALGTILGAPIGYFSAKKVKMTSMPEMVALFNGVGGGAVALIALSEYFHWTDTGAGITTDVEVASLFSLIIGSISFWGSVVAFLKLSERISGRPIALPGQKLINAALFLGAIGIAGYLLVSSGMDPYSYTIGIAVLAGVLGLFFVLPIGGADMPVVISTLNAMTGLAAAAAGFALGNSALIVAGMIVGASGTILTNLMAVAMNRTIAGVLFGSFGAGTGGGTAPAGGGASREGATVRSTDAASAAILMAYAQNVIVVPGYGLAVAQAQHTVREMADELESKGVTVKYAIHPVAGRMPGHMNVLLAEADVPYDQLVEMDDINPEFERADVAIVVGANDVTNPAAKNSPDSPIYGMPILEVDQAHNVIVLKRGMSSGYAGIENELYYDPKTQMLFGDAKDSLSEVVQELKNV